MQIVFFLYAELLNLHRVDQGFLSERRKQRGGRFLHLHRRRGESSPGGNILNQRAVTYIHKHTTRVDHIHTELELGLIRTPTKLLTGQIEL